MKYHITVGSSLQILFEKEKNMKKEVVKVNNQDVSVKEFNGQRVVAFKDIDVVHERPEGTAGRNFRENKEHLIEGEDYFRRNSSEAKKEFGVTAPNGLILLTESGYLMLVKSFTDDLAWKVQRQLVKSYFTVKEQKQEKPKKKNLSATNMLVKTVSGIFKDAGVSPLFIAAEAKRLYKEQADIDIHIPLITDKSDMPKLYDCTEIAKELGIMSTSGKPHNQAVSAILSKLDIEEDEIVTTAFTRNGHEDITTQYKPSVYNKVHNWLDNNGYPEKIPYTDAKGNYKTYSVVYQEVA